MFICTRKPTLFNDTQTLLQRKCLYIHPAEVSSTSCFSLRGQHSRSSASTSPCLYCSMLLGHTNRPQVLHYIHESSLWFSFPPLFYVPPWPMVMSSRLEIGWGVQSICNGLRLEPLLLHIQINQLRWFKHLIRILPGWDVLGTCHQEEVTLGYPQDRWGYISWLAWECFVVPLDGLEEMVMREDTSDINFVNCGPN